MAITLDELLGRNTVKDAEEQSVGRFPSFEDFQNSGFNRQSPEINEKPRYNFDSRPYTPPRTVDSVRSYEASKPYEAPRSSEYQSRNYDFLDTIDRRAQNGYDGYDDNNRYGYSQYESYAKPQYSTRRQQMSLYEFTANDRDRLPKSTLEEKLDYTNSGRRPVLDRQTNGAIASKTFAQAKIGTREKSQTKSRPKLSWKGKVIVGAFVAFIITVATLIIVNAGAINSGTAPMPAGNAPGSSVILAE